jgi:hypothetical protein
VIAFSHSKIQTKDAKMSLKKSVLALSLFTSFLYAGESSESQISLPKIKMDWRLDFAKFNNENSGYPGFNALTSAQKNNNEGKSFRIYLNYIRMDLSGKYTDDISYKLKFRLNKSAELNTPDIDGSSKFLDYAYFDKKFLPELTVRLGKQALYHGGWEGYPSSRDMYSFSACSFSDYRTGVGFISKFNDENELIVQVANNKFGEYNQTGLLYGGQYTGKFFNKLFQPILAYHVDNGTDQKTSGTAPASSSTTTLAADMKARKETYFAVGTRSELYNFDASLDYLKNTAAAYVNNNTSTSKSYRDTSTTSWTTTLKYKYEKFLPQFKYSYSKVGNSNALQSYTHLEDRNTYHAVLEYYPEEKKDIRVHVGYISETFKPDSASGLSTTKNKTYLVGFAGGF